MSRIVLLGANSFISKALATAAAVRDIACIVLPHNAALDTLEAQDSLFNFALTPAYRSGPYEEDQDCDLRAARAAAAAGAWFGMLSTRRVYGPAVRWGALEEAPAEGDETRYGQNKSRTEKAVRSLLDGQAGIFRLSNIFGYEYDRHVRRGTFLGVALRSLKDQNKILFDMSPDSRRDFLPVEHCANLLLDRGLSRTAGIYNLGSGLPLACGSLAEWVMEGFGGGELISSADNVRDEFYLHMDKWRAEFPLSINKEALRDYCVGLGRKLTCEKF